jgi:hypothetical protein
MSVRASVPLPTVFGEYVVEQHVEEAQRSVLLAHGQEIGIAAIWIVFYAVLAIAAAIHVFHTVA